jgi:8-oxo-dGTP pyrophosphatase MutT (NUDIX family)
MSPRSRFYYRDPTAPEQKNPRRLGVIALIERDGMMLLERRVDAPVWSFIAGSVEDTETLIETLRREVLEETGFIVSGCQLFGTFTDPTRIISYADGNVVRFSSFAYSVEVESFDSLQVSDESEELRFFLDTELCELAMPATQRPVVERLLSGDRPPHLK